MTFLRVRDFSAAILIDKSGRLLLQLRDDRPDIEHPGRVALFGGRREGDETSLECIVREVSEEIGAALPPEHFKHLVSLDQPDPENSGGYVKGEYFVSRGIEASSLNVAEGKLLIVDREEIRGIWDKLTPLTVLVLNRFFELVE